MQRLLCCLFPQPMEWVPDSEEPRCSCCRSTFTFFSRRHHHCRSCYHNVCYECIDGNKVCTTCRLSTPSEEKVHDSSEQEGSDQPLHHVGRIADGSLEEEEATSRDRFSELHCMEKLIGLVAQEETQDFLQNVEIMVDTDWPHVFATAIGYYELMFKRLNNRDELQILMVCFLLAEKYLLDDCANNAQYAQQNNTAVAIVNELEVEALVALEFQLHISLSEAEQIGEKVGLIFSQRQDDDLDLIGDCQDEDELDAIDAFEQDDEFS
eukprot:TRINITY_DN260_c0_g2_i4.p1 TRINITY_DN260_c0_g2~~TRINITY_DN260_c0_g2_i4.p1  ORF type:complete len:266 (-),score=59.83 TRINITY_DN260_c0_g2_i4:122-919(-)